MEADKKEKTRHNQFIKTAQPYKPKVRRSPPQEADAKSPGQKERLSPVCPCVPSLSPPVSRIKREAKRRSWT